MHQSEYPLCIEMFTKTSSKGNSTTRCMDAALSKEACPSCSKKDVLFGSTYTINPDGNASLVAFCTECSSSFTYLYSFEDDSVTLID